MHDFNGPLQQRNCLVSNWGGCTEGVAIRRPAAHKWETPHWIVKFPASRGKGGKETFTIIGIAYEEGDSFVLL